jgi:hypothetical protein
VSHGGKMKAALPDAVIRAGERVVVLAARRAAADEPS